MRLVVGLAFVLVLLAGASAPALADADRAKRDWIFERSRLLFELDRAAWVGTDDMAEHIRDPVSLGMRGFIVEPEDGGYRVIFYGGAGDAPVAFYRGRVENRRVVSREVFPAHSRPPLTPLQRRLAAAREAAGRVDHRPCEGPGFNTVVIPPAELDDVVDVYLLTPQLRAQEWPLGGHFRVQVAVDGDVVSSRAFTTSCINLGGRSPNPDEELSALFVTHILDPLPTEIHVFTMMTSGLPLGVGTTDPDRVWWVSGRGIELEEEIDD